MTAARSVVELQAVVYAQGNEVARTRARYFEVLVELHEAVTLAELTGGAGRGADLRMATVAADKAGDHVRLARQELDNQRRELDKAIDAVLREGPGQ